MAIKTMLTVAVLFSAAFVASEKPASAYSEPYCREYVKNVVVAGRVQQSYGTACMQPDGSWQIQQDYGAIPAGYNPPPQVVVLQDPQPYPIYVERSPRYVRTAPPPFFSLNINSYDRDYYRSGRRDRHWHDHDHGHDRRYFDKYRDRHDHHGRH